MEIPAPKLRHAFRLRVELGAPIEMGQGRAGVRRIIQIIGGKALGPDLTGAVLTLAPGGGNVNQEFVKNGAGRLIMNGAISGGGSHFDDARRLKLRLQLCEGAIRTTDPKRRHSDPVLAENLEVPHPATSPVCLGWRLSQDLEELSRGPRACHDELRDRLGRCHLDPVRNPVLEHVRNDRFS